MTDCGRMLNISPEITALMDALQMRKDLKGYNYVCASLQIYIQLANGHRKVRMMNDIYPQVARIYNTTPQCVERNMRHAIELTFTSGNYKLVNQIFGGYSDPDNGKLTNGDFIVVLAAHLGYRTKYFPHRRA